MNVGVLIFSTLGGTTSFVTGIIFVIRAILKNVGATKENTVALNEVTELVNKLQSGFDDVKIRVAILEDRGKR